MTADPAYGETSSSYGHQYKITASGRVTNGTSASVQLDYSYPVTVSVRDQHEPLRVTSRPYGTLSAGESGRWEASGDYMFYDDPSIYRPYLSAEVLQWKWADYADSSCPTS